MPSRRKPIHWPDSARIALVFCVSWETWPDDLGTNASHQRSNRGKMPENAIYKKDMGVVMDRQFGDKCGIWRILDMFDREGIKATFFLNGRTAEENVDAVKELVAKGHELAAQSYIHEYTVTMDKEGERNTIQGSIDAFKKVAGRHAARLPLAGRAPDAEHRRVDIGDGLHLEQRGRRRRRALRRRSGRQADRGAAEGFPPQRLHHL